MQTARSPLRSTEAGAAVAEGRRGEAGQEAGERAARGLERPCRGWGVLRFHSEKGGKFLEGLSEEGQDLTDVIGFLWLHLWGGVVGGAWELED